MRAEPQPQHLCPIRPRSRCPTRRRDRKNHSGLPSSCRRGRRSHPRHLPPQQTHSASPPPLLALRATARVGGPPEGYGRPERGPYTDERCPRLVLRGGQVLRLAPDQLRCSVAPTPPILAL